MRDGEERELRREKCMKNKNGLTQCRFDGMFLRQPAVNHSAHAITQTSDGISARKIEEQRAGFQIKAIDQSGIEGIEPLIHDGNTRYPSPIIPRSFPGRP